MIDNNLCFDPLEGITSRSLDLLKNPLFWVHFNPEETIPKRGRKLQKGGTNPSLKSSNRRDNRCMERGIERGINHLKGVQRTS